MTDEERLGNRPFEWEFILSVLEHRPAMWLQQTSPTYEAAVAFVRGFDLAQDVGFSGGMQARVDRRHRATRLDWASVLAAEAIGADATGPGEPCDLTPEQNMQAIRLLVSELRAVLGL